VGQLGDGTLISRPSPEPIARPGMHWKARTPTLGTVSGTYLTDQAAEVTSMETGTTLHYILNGIDPTGADPVIASGGTVAITGERRLEGQRLENRMLS
jgi:hypothetical protein